MRRKFREEEDRAGRFHQRPPNILPEDRVQTKLDELGKLLETQQKQLGRLANRIQKI
jgi:hypothetical protein